MKKSMVAILLLGTLLLSGCSLLEREYSSVSEHSASYYESSDASILRAENYQDIVNDILVVIGNHEETGTIWLYTTQSAQETEESVAKACTEVQEKTPIGAYAVEYLTFAVSTGKSNYNEISINIQYGKTEEEVNNIIHTNSANNIKDLLSNAIDRNKEALVVQLTYSDHTADEIRGIVLETLESKEIDTDSWSVRFYPNEETVDIVEIIKENG